MFFQSTKRIWATALALASITGSALLADTTIEVTAKPGGTWQARPSRLLGDLPAVAPDKALDPYGGLPSAKVKRTGFFRAEKIGNRWWLITPAGGLFVSRGVNSVGQIDTRGARDALKKRFGSTEAWAGRTLELLRGHGFNTLGAWTDSGSLESAKAPMARTLNWSFMSSYGKVRGGTHQKPGHTGYPGDCPFIFDPGFADFCESYATRLDAFKDDPWVIGHFSDNELPWSRKLLEDYLALPAADPGHKAALGWLQARRGKTSGTKAVSETDRAEFLEFAMDRYLSVTTAAIRKHAPNHLVLGPRIHGAALRFPEVFRSLGRHGDVLAVNWYGAWTPDARRLAMWNQESGKPVMITEFYAKAESSGMANTGGAGWLVKTQKDRGGFYQNFTLGLIESRVCVGWHWHRYADNDPEDRRQDPSNRDSNKGLVNNRYAPYTDLLAAMGQVNHRVHGIAGHFDSRQQ